MRFLDRAYFRKLGIFRLFLSDNVNKAICVKWWTVERIYNGYKCVRIHTLDKLSLSMKQVSPGRRWLTMDVIPGMNVYELKLVIWRSTHGEYGLRMCKVLYDTKLKI